MEARRDNLKNRIEKANMVLLGKITELLPGGKISGGKYRCDNIKGGYGENPSLTVCLETGKITDFGSNGYGVLKLGDKGHFYGDIFDVHCWTENIPESERYKEAARLVGEPDGEKPKVKKEAKKYTHNPGMELDASLRKKENLYKYYKDGGLWCCKEGKTLLWVPTKEKGWICKHSEVKDFTKPIYVAGEVKDGDMAIGVEGEKCAEAMADVVKKYFPGVVVFTVGGKSDFSNPKCELDFFKGKTVILWADADRDGGGLEAMKSFGRKIESIGATVRIVKIDHVTEPEKLEKGWDIVDEVEAKITKDDFVKRIGEAEPLPLDNPKIEGMMSYSQIRQGMKEGSIKKIYIQTGFPQMDSLMGGGVGNGELLTVAGYSGHGKSLILGNMAVSMARQEKTVIFITNEMKQSELVERCDKNVGAEEPCPSIWFIEFEFDFSVIAKKIKEFEKKVGKVDAIFYDHINNVTVEKSEKEQLVTKQSIQFMQRLAKEHDFRAIVACQNNDEPFKENRLPTLRDTRGSKTIGHCTDKHLVLYKPRGKVKGWLILDKHRHGLELGKVPVVLNVERGLLLENGPVEYHTEKDIAETGAAKVAELPPYENGLKVREAIEKAPMHPTKKEILEMFGEKETDEKIRRLGLLLTKFEKDGIVEATGKGSAKKYQIKGNKKEGKNTLLH